MKHTIIVILKFMLIAVFTIANLNLFAQELDPVQQQLQNIGVSIPPSPTAASLAKFADVQVNHFNGMVNISIPLWNVTSRELSVPISIAYHSQGIRVQENAGWVGLGWALNAGGVITRNMRGKFDEAGGTGYNIVGLNFPTHDEYLANGWQPTNTYLEQFVLGNKDGQADIYSFNFNGYSGQFFYNPHDTTYYCIPKQKILIKKPSANEWILTTPDGTQYFFGENAEETTVSTSGTMGNQTYSSAWYLTKILSPTKQDEIKFYYTSKELIPGDLVVTESKNIPIVPGSCNLSTPSHSNTHVSTQTRHLTRIESDNCIVDFISNTNNIREDFSNGQGRKLFSIEIKENNVVSNMVKKYSFDYGYYNSQSSNHLDKRLRLDSITEIGSDLDTLPKYKFFYNSDPLPARDSKDIDHYGFYNDANNTTLIPQLPIYPEGGNREPNDTTMDNGILEMITYPTGGSESFYYEGNYISEEISENNFEKVFVGGLRISKTEKSADATSSPLITNYSYSLESNSNISSGVMTNSKPIYYYSSRPDPENIDCQLYTAVSNNVVNYTSGTPICYTQVLVSQGENNEVGSTRYFYNFIGDVGSNGFPFAPPTNNSWRRGKLVKQKVYNSVDTLIKEIVNDYEYTTFGGAQSTVIWNMKAAYNINTPDSAAFDVFYWEPFYLESGWSYLKSTTITEYDDQGNNPNESIINYYYDNPDHLLLTKTKTTKSDSSIIYNEWKYPADYDFSSSNIEYLGQGASAIYKMKNELHMHAYPIEIFSWKYTTEVHKDVIKGVIKSYKDYGTNQIMNDRVFALENSLLLTDYEKSSITSDQFEYDNRYKLLENYNYDAYSNITEKSIRNEIDESYLWGYNNSLPTAQIRNAKYNEVFYTSFEEETTGITTNDSKSKTGSMYKNVSGPYLVHDDLPDGDYILTYWWKPDDNEGTAWEFFTKDYAGYQNGNLMTLTKTSGYYDEIRIMPKDAKMATYTYEPLIGVTSITDENNQTLKFFYDNFGRLLMKKDHKGNILEKYKYRYKDE